MTWEIFNRLLNEFTYPYLTEYVDEDYINRDIHVQDYPIFLRQLQNDTYEAFREFKFKTTDFDYVDLTLSGAQKKISNSFRRIFHKKIEDWDGKSSLFYVPTEQWIKYKFKDTFSKVVFDLAFAGYDTFNYLESLKSYNEMKPKKGIRESRKVSDLQDFKLSNDISDIMLSSLYEKMIKDGYIEVTSFENFKLIFSGRPADSALIWKLNNVYLSMFIKGIEGRAIKKLNDGKWEVICKIFKNKDGGNYTAKQLREPGSTTTDKETSRIEYLINEFNDTVLG